VLGMEASGTVADMQARYAERWDYDSAQEEFRCVERQRIEHGGHVLRATCARAMERDD